MNASEIADFEIVIEQAKRNAFARLADRLGERFDPEPQVRLVNRDDFFAQVSWNADGTIVEVSKGCLQSICLLCHDALRSKVLIDAKGRKITHVDGMPVTAESLLQLSVTWLILHELIHIRLGHLDILNAAALVECDTDLTDPYEIDEHWSAELDESEKALMRPCLELQADNDATEIMFGVYAESEWTRFRIEAAAIFVVMSVMERAETEANLSARTYPKVATRFFALFAQLFQYWLYGDAELVEGDGESFVRTARQPTGEDFQRYMKFVIALSVNDAIQIALLADAKSFLDDLGAGEALFSDLFAIQYADDLIAADLKTPAANEWRALLPINEKIMRLSGLRDD